MRQHRRRAGDCKTNWNDDADMHRLVQARRTNGRRGCKTHFRDCSCLAYEFDLSDSTTIHVQNLRAPFRPFVQRLSASSVNRS